MIPFLFALLIAIPFGCFVHFSVEEMEKEKLRFLYFSHKKNDDESLFLKLNRPAAQILVKRFSLGEIPAFALLLGLELGGMFLFLLGFGIPQFLAGALMGGAYPYLWRRHQRISRLTRIKRELPLVIDLLAILVGAGIDIFQALKRIESFLPKNDLVVELSRMLSEVQLGKTRQEALQHFKERVPIIEVRSLVAMLSQTLKLGSPLAPVLIANADQMRASRFLEAERLGVKAAQKILFPLIFCVLPSVFITIFSPLAIRFYTQGLEGFL